MKKKSLVVLTVLGALLSLTFSCKTSPTEPERRIKTPREMTWTSTTITSPDSTSIQVLPENLVVFSESDMWLVCWSDVARGLLWHYDGKSWTESNIVADVGGMRVNDVAGYSSSDLWTAGYSGDKIFLAHYDGMHWTRWNNMNINGELLDMTKDPEGNIWACGRNGVILKYDKTQWIVDSVKIDNYKTTDYNLYSIEYHNGAIYISAWIKGNKYANIKGEIKNWKVLEEMTIDSPTSEIKWGNFGLYSLQYNKLYSYGLEGIWEYSNSSWKKSFSFDGEMYNMYGASENYIIGVSAFRRIYYYDGVSWQSISDIFNVTDPTFVFSNVWTNGYETVVVGYGMVNGIQKTIIFHGK